MSTLPSKEELMEKALLSKEGRIKVSMAMHTRIRENVAKNLNKRVSQAWCDTYHGPLTEIGEASCPECGTLLVPSGV